MKNIIIHGAMICALLIASCNKEEVLPEGIRQNTPSKKNYVIDINTTRSAGNILGAVTGNGLGPATRAMGDDPFTEIREVECFESVVLPELQPHIWIGNIMPKSSVVNCVYKPLIYPRKPITVSLTLPGTSPQQIETPSYSKYLTYIQEQTQKGTFAQNGEFSFSTEQFTSYNELKVAFGSNVNTNGIFWGSSSSSSSSDHLINKATGLYIKFYQTSFKAIMDYPQDQIATIPSNMIDSAVYINSISYGRLGILTLETNETAYEAKDKIEKIFRTIFYSSSSTFTKEEQSFLNGCDFKVYLIGGNGNTSVESFSGLTGFIQHIKKGTFSKDVPGTPIFCTFNHVKDNSPVSIKFKFNVKKEPIYVEIKHEPILNVPKTEQFLGSVNYSKIKGYGQIRIYFYRNRAKVPTIADPRIPIKVGKKWKRTDIYTDGKKYENENTNEYEMKNAGNQTSMVLSWPVTYGPRGNTQTVNYSILSMYSFYPRDAHGKPTSYSHDTETTMEYYVIDTGDYEILGSPLNQYNCPLGRLE